MLFSKLSVLAAGQHYIYIYAQVATTRLFHPFFVLPILSQ